MTGSGLRYEVHAVARARNEHQYSLKGTPSSSGQTRQTLAGLSLSRPATISRLVAFGSAGFIVIAHWGPCLLRHLRRLACHRPSDRSSTSRRQPCQVGITSIIVAHPSPHHHRLRLVTHQLPSPSPGWRTHLHRRWHLGPAKSPGRASAKQAPMSPGAGGGASVGAAGRRNHTTTGFRVYNCHQTALDSVSCAPHYRLTLLTEY